MDLRSALRRNGLQPAWLERKTGKVFHLAASLTTLATVLLDYLAEWSWPKVKAAFNHQASAATDCFHLGKSRSSPILPPIRSRSQRRGILHPLAFLPWQTKSSSTRTKELADHGRVFVFFLTMERWQLEAQLCREQFHTLAPLGCRVNLRCGASEEA